MVSPGKQTACGHAICADCTKQLRKAECPVCRARLEAGYLTQDAAQAIEAAGRQDARVREYYDLVYAEYLNMDPGRTDRAARDYADAFSLFLSNNETTPEETIRIFRGFVYFVQLEQMLNPDLTPAEAINPFSLIGIQMLDAPELTFNDIYDMFYRTTH